MSRPTGLYRLLLRAYPDAFRARYGREMEEAFQALLHREGKRAGAVGRARVWVGAAADAVLRGGAMRVATVLGTRGKEREGMMGTFSTDLRFAVRALWRRPAFAATAILTIALGIGANAAVFTVVNGFLLEPLPYEDPSELVVIQDANPELGWEDTDVSPANAWDWRARARTLEDLAIHYGDDFNLTGDGAPELVTAARVTPNLFDVLGREPVLGRDFAADELGEGRDKVVILTHGFWTRRFGADPDVLGRTLDFDGDAYTVIGVLPADFRFVNSRPEVFVPQDVHPRDAQRVGHYAEAMARLADGVRVEEAAEELREIAGQLAAEHPESNAGWTVDVSAMHGELVGPVARQASVVLLAAVAFVLLMVCVNVANLLLARAGGRVKELSVRAALGAGRARVVRQLLTESLVLGVVGAAAGLAMGAVGARAIVAGLPSVVPPVFRFEMNANVYLYVTGVTLGAVLLFGLVPALNTARDAADALRDGGRSGPGRSARRFGATLVVVQTAMAVVLLVAGGLLMKSIAGMRAQDFGFDPEGVITMRIAPPSSSYVDADALRAFWDAVEDRVASLPGVEAVGTTQSHPLMGSNWGGTLRIAGIDEGPNADRTVRTTHASAGLFDALGFRVVQGRGIDGRDVAEGQRVAVVNETFVARYLPEGTDPLSHRILAESADDPISIVGVIEDPRERSVDDPPEPSWYVPASQAVTRTRSLVVRAADDPSALLPLIQDAVWSVDPTLPVFQVETMEALVARRVGSFAVIAEIMAAFALLSLLLGAVGIYGVTAHATEQRHGEIGVRLAMGARRSDVVRMVVFQGARRALLGLLVGVGLAFGLAGLLGSVLVGVAPNDPMVFATVAAVLGVVSLIGVYLPARRASRTDPVRALASE